MKIQYCIILGTASYYKRLGLIDESVDITDEETDINILFEMALQRLVFMPFGYLVCTFRNNLRSSVEHIVSQPFLIRGTLTKFCRYLAAPLDGQKGIKIMELY